MYLKLAWRNALRSGRDYGVYLFTLTVLTALMAFANLTAAAGAMQAGFQTAALPALIALIMAVLLAYLRRFICRQRARELAAYALLGMDQGLLGWLFALEFALLGAACLGAGLVLGVLLFRCLAGGLSVLLALPLGMNSALLLPAAGQTALAFLTIEVFSLLSLGRTIQRAELSRLLRSGREVRRPSRGRGWRLCLIISAGSFFPILLAIALVPGAQMLLSVEALPLIGLVVSFYQVLCRVLDRRRDKAWLYRGDRLAVLGSLLADPAAGGAVNAVLCLCLIFSGSAFLAGGVILRLELEAVGGRWMGFLQLCIGAVFLVLALALTAVGQMTELARDRRGFAALGRMGRSRRELGSLLAWQTGLRFTLPAGPALALIVGAGLLLDGLVGRAAGAPGLLAGLTGIFSAGFLTLWGLYFPLALAAGRRIALEYQRTQ